MPIVVFGSVLFAALLHAGWNAIVKSGDDKLLSTILVATSAALVAALVLPFLEQPAAASWPFIAASVLIHVLYFALVAVAYRLADMGQAYPLMRGTAPLLVALVSAFVIGETLSQAAWIGVSLISFGILAMVAEGRRSNGRGLIVALGNAVVIGGYTLIDGSGARVSDAPVSYAAWVFLLTGVVLAVWVAIRHGGRFFAFAARRWQLGLTGGAATVTSYALALWAMTLAPVAVVAALRETSILFATVIAGVVLRERVSSVRIAGACVIALGAAALRLA